MKKFTAQEATRLSDKYKIEEAKTFNQVISYIEIFAKLGFKNTSMNLRRKDMKVVVKELRDRGFDVWENEDYIDIQWD